MAKETPKTPKTKPSQPELEQPAAAETDVTKAAEQESEVITKKRSSQPGEATAKAGKRSSKAIKAAAEKQAKEDRKATGEAVETKPKPPLKPTRSRLERRGKQFRQQAAKIEKDKLYSLAAAAKLAKETSYVKFDATVELHVNLNVDPRQADQNIRDTLVLPAGTGKSVKIAVLTDDAATARKAGADYAGADELLAQLDKDNLDFDILIATPQLMPRLGKYARILGPRGLMPSPKSGTVTNDIDKAVAEARAGRVEYRVDSTGIVHLGVGKVSFDEAKLLDNIQAVLASIKGNKPQSVKSNYLSAVYLTTTMGPSIKIDTASIS